MIERSTLSTGEFIKYFFFTAYFMIISYKNYVFRCLQGWSYQGSMIILFGILVSVLFIWSTFFFAYNKTKWAVFVTALLGFGIYTLLAYSEVAERFKNLLFGVAAVISIILSIMILTRKIKRKKYKIAIIINRCYRCFYSTQSVIAMAMAVFMCAIGISRVSDFNILGLSIRAEKGISKQEETIAKNIDTVLLLQEKEWQKLSENERKKVLQTVANIEAHYLGLSNRLYIEIIDMPENTLGLYCDEVHTIYINKEHFLTSPSNEVLQSVCHEAYHSYQYRLIDLYQNTSEDFLRLRIFKKATSYADEFSHYISGSEDFYEYYNQMCEKDAREYSESAVKDYYRRIYEYTTE